MGFAYPAALLAVSAALAASAASAEEPQTTTSEKAPTEQPAAPVAQKAPTWAKARAKAKDPVPLRISVEATSPDPPWKLRIENTGERAVRVPADVRLLSLELTHASTKGAKRTHKCVAPRAMRPTSFPIKRELYLEPGESYEEVFDPRLLCFGAATDALTEGTRVEPTFGFAGAGPKGPFAAQGLDRPEEHAPLRSIKADALELPTTTPASVARGGVSSPMPTMEREGTRGGPPALGAYEAVDRNVAQLDIFVERFEEASSPRDITLTIRAVNEGQRKLATLVRGRMLTFFIEELAHDGSVRSSFACSGQHAPHAIPIEMMQNVRPGQTVRVPILLAEVCPRDAVFLRPGLYRVTPKLDPDVRGEGLEVDPYLADALARQSALVRLATASGAYYEGPPRRGAAQTEPGATLDRVDAPAK